MKIALSLIAALVLIGGLWGRNVWRDYAALPAPVACTLPSDSQLLISCTENCGFFNTRALQRAARRLDYALEIIPDLSRQSEDMLSRLDGLIIPGGADIDPRYYTTGLPEPLQVRIQALDSLVVYTAEGRRRDAFEYQLLQRYFSDPSLSRLPILGICRGMQMLSVSQGIPLYVDINTELGLRMPKHHLDRVSVVDESSRIGGLAAGPHFLASQVHHQAMRYDYFQARRDHFATLRVTALSHRGRIAEVLEFTDRPVIGTQFHPEYTPGPIRARLFEWLLGKACQKKRFVHQHGGSPATTTGQ